ncbi:MAG: hypothetical protein J6J43_00870 [Oscillospiraceae bacterium]|nr:hypothetical protein [Oscillospiraceae bacterium]
MTRKRFAALLLLVLCLTGCKAEGPTQTALDLRTKLMQAQTCGFTAQIRSDHGEKVYEFTADVRYSPEETVVEITSPEELQGIRAKVTEDGAKLEYDGVELTFGTLANGKVSPMSAPWLLVQCWIGEYISHAGADGELERVTYLRGYDDEEIMLDTWLNVDGIPAYAEVAYDGVRCLSIQIRDFQF